MQYVYNACDWLLSSEKLSAGGFLLFEIVTKKIFGGIELFLLQKSAVKIGQNAESACKLLPLNA